MLLTNGELECERACDSEAPYLAPHQHRRPFSSARRPFAGSDVCGRSFRFADRGRQPKGHPRSDLRRASHDSQIYLGASVQGAGFGSFRCCPEKTCRLGFLVGYRGGIIVTRKALETGPVTLKPLEHCRSPHPWISSSRIPATTSMTCGVAAGITMFGHGC